MSTFSTSGLSGDYDFGFNRPKEVFEIDGWTSPDYQTGILSVGDVYSGGRTHELQMAECLDGEIYTAPASSRELSIANNPRMAFWTRQIGYKKESTTKFTEAEVDLIPRAEAILYQECVDRLTNGRFSKAEQDQMYVISGVIYGKVENTRTRGLEIKKTDEGQAFTTLSQGLGVPGSQVTGLLPEWERSKTAGVSSDGHVAVAYKAIPLRELLADPDLYSPEEIARDGDVIIEDPELVEIYKSADSGHVRAQTDLAWAYKKGEGVPRNPSKAFHWMKRAADSGDLEAKYWVGKWYTKGYGTTRLDYKGKAYLEEAIAGGYGKAHLALGYYYLRDHAILAKTPFKQAVQNGYAEGYYGLGRVEEKLGAATCDAMAYFEKGAEQGCDKCQRKLDGKYGDKICD